MAARAGLRLWVPGRVMSAGFHSAVSGTKSLRIRTYELLDLKSFRMRTYKNMGRGRRLLARELRAYRLPSKRVRSSGIQPRGPIVNLGLAV